MRIRLHEIETGVSSLTPAADILSSVLGLSVKLQQEALTVFESGLPGVDVNISHHLPEGGVRISFITDDIQTVIQRLQTQQLAYEGPYESHLGMLSIRFVIPNGIEIVVNTATDISPEWLKV